MASKTFGEMFDKAIDKTLADKAFMMFAKETAKYVKEAKYYS